MRINVHFLPPVAEGSDVVTCQSTVKLFSSRSSGTVRYATITEGLVNLAGAGDLAEGEREHRWSVGVVLSLQQVQRLREQMKSERPLAFLSAPR
ncbi:Hypothetical protein NTJ_03005 [Nesidiocoris tenuis]|uniref:Thioesterase domain-containing protein n=1 Tax=Nesidiocoris tenuis TaxID=355587 RepID=A0ABN7AG14_9HEMI|nr:Hypothetical protein NTJ_03005 [Nesidiocoris tenuis]